MEVLLHKDRSKEKQVSRTRRSALVDTLLASDQDGSMLMEKFAMERTDKHHLSQVWWSVVHNRREEEAEVPDGCVPSCLMWDQDQVASWLRCIGFPQYMDAFLTNCVDGRKLVWVDADKLCKMGICDFDHIRNLTAGIRYITGNVFDDKYRSIALPPRGPRTTFLRIRSRQTPEKNPIVFKCFLRKEGYNAIMGCVVREHLPRPTKCCIFGRPFVPTKYALLPLDPRRKGPTVQLCPRCLMDEWAARQERKQEKTSRVALMAAGQ